MYDVIIIGGGVAGLAAAIYTCRRNLKTLVLTMDIGGQLATASIVENYPGVEKISGSQLAQKFFNQAKGFGAEIKFEEVKNINSKNNSFEIETKTNQYNSKAVIIACGLAPRKLQIPGEEEFLGKGVSYCATCDAPLFKGKICGVVGGGSAALDAAILLADISPKVYLIHRREEFTAEPILETRLKEKKNVVLVLNSVVKEIKGKEKVTNIVVENIKTGEKKEIPLDGLFIEIGHEAKVNFVKDLVKVNERNEIIINNKMQTSYPGIFACGDITAGSYRQAVISAAQGVQAALEVYKYLLNKKGEILGPTADWSSKI